MSIGDLDTISDLTRAMRAAQRPAATLRVLEQQAHAFNTAGKRREAAQLRLVACLVRGGAMTAYEGEQWRRAAAVTLTRLHRDWSI